MKNRLRTGYAKLMTLDNVALLKGGGIIFFIKVIAAILAFVSTIIITRYSHSQSDVGQYFFILSLLAVTTTVSRAGFDNVLTRFIALANKDQNYPLLTAVYQFIFTKVMAFTLIAASSIASVSYLLFSLSYIESGQLNLLLIAAFLMIFLNMNIVFVQCYQGIKKSFKYALFNALSRVLLFVFLIFSLLFYQQMSLLSLLLFYGSANIIAALISYVFWKKETCVIKMSNTAIVPKKAILKSANTLWGVSIFAIIMSNGAAVLLGFISQPEEVALFAAANRIALLVSFILIAVNGILSPKFAELSNDVNSESGRIKLQGVYRSSTGLMLIITLPLFILIFYYSKFILSLFGQEYISGVSVLRLIIGAFFVKVLVGSVGQLLVMTGNERYQRRCLTISVIILLVLLFSVVPSYGALGASFAVFCAVVVNNLLGLFYVRRKLNISLL
ncbi:oligosaccharide flippase family protein [Thalassotalea piscium]